MSTVSAVATHHDPTRPVFGYSAEPPVAGLLVDHPHYIRSREARDRAFDARDDAVRDRDVLAVVGMRWAIAHGELPTATEAAEFRAVEVRADRARADVRYALAVHRQVLGTLGLACEANQ